jgi:hypothetical protein
MSDQSAGKSGNSQEQKLARLPWGAVKEKQNSIYNKNFLSNLKNTTINLDGSLASSTSSLQHLIDSTNPSTGSSIAEKQKPGEYLMHLVMLNFIQLTSNRFEQVINGEKRDKRLKDCLQKSEDIQLEQLVMTMGAVAEQCLPSLLRTLLIWFESQLNNLNYLKQQQQIIQKQQADAAQTANTNSKVNLKVKQQQLLQAKLFVLFLIYFIYYFSPIIIFFKRK